MKPVAMAEAGYLRYYEKNGLRQMRLAESVFLVIL